IIPPLAAFVMKFLSCALSCLAPAFAVWAVRFDASVGAFGFPATGVFPKGLSALALPAMATHASVAIEIMIDLFFISFLSVENAGAFPALKIRIFTRPWT